MSDNADAGTVTAVITALFDRPPVAGEVRAWLDVLDSPVDVIVLAASLKSSLEFQQRQLFHVRGMAASRTGPPLFLLHIPKTAGRALRQALEAALGLPALVFASTEQWLGKSHFTGFAETAVPNPAESWPFLTGHNHLDDYPRSHLGVTVWREPRARLLSLHRFSTSDLHQGNLGDLGDLGDLDKAFLVHQQARRRMSLSQWLDDYIAYEMPSHWWLMPGTRDLHPSEVHSMSRAEVLPLVDRGVTRMMAAGWHHRSADLHRLVRRISGRAPRIESVNVTEPSGGLIEIDEATLGRLTELTAVEAVVGDHLADLGVLPLLDPAEAQAIFEQTAKRLGYVTA